LCVTLWLDFPAHDMTKWVARDLTLAGLKKEAKEWFAPLDVTAYTLSVTPDLDGSLSGHETTTVLSLANKMGVALFYALAPPELRDNKDLKSLLEAFPQWRNYCQFAHRIIKQFGYKTCITRVAEFEVSKEAETKDRAQFAEEVMKGTISMPKFSDSDLKIKREIPFLEEENSVRDALTKLNAKQSCYPTVKDCCVVKSLRVAATPHDNPHFLLRYNPHKRIWESVDNDLPEVVLTPVRPTRG